MSDKKKDITEDFIIGEAEDIMAPVEGRQEFDDDYHISEQGDGSKEQNMDGIGRVEERIETKINEDDGVIEDHISYIPMQASRYFFGNSDNLRFRKNYENIDWNDD